MLFSHIEVEVGSKNDDERGEKTKGESLLGESW